MYGKEEQGQHIVQHGDIDPKLRTWPIGCRFQSGSSVFFDAGDIEAIDSEVGVLINHRIRQTSSLYNKSCDTDTITADPVVLRTIPLPLYSINCQRLLASG